MARLGGYSILILATSALEILTPPTSPLPLVTVKVLLTITQDFISFCYLFEFFFSVRTFVFIRMILERHFSVCLLDFLVGGALRDAEKFVIIFPHGLSIKLHY